MFNKQTRSTSLKCSSVTCCSLLCDTAYISFGAYLDDMYAQKWIPAGKQWFALIAGGNEMVPREHTHPGGSCCHWSADLTGDQSGFILGPRQAGAQLRSRPEGEE